MPCKLLRNWNPLKGTRRLPRVGLSKSGRDRVSQGVAESLDDLALDVPDAKKQFVNYVERAKTNGWLDSSFYYGNSTHVKENGTCM